MKLKIIQLNIDSIFHKLKELRIFVEIQQPHMLFLNETKLDPTKEPPKIRGYDSILKSREKNGGGVAIYFKSNINVTEVPINSRFETVGALLNNILYIALYNPGKFNIQEADITNLLEAHPKTIVIGDFNCRSTDWGDYTSNTNGKRLANICQNKDYLILTPDEPTFYRGQSSSIIDIAIAKNIYATNIEVLHDLNSDHRPVVFTFENIHNIPLLPENRRRNYSEANWTKYKKEVTENLKLNREISTIEQIDKTIQDFTKIIISAADSSIPWIKEGKPNLPQNILQHIQERNRARRRCQRNPTPENVADLNIKKYVLEEALKQHYTETWQRRIREDAKKRGNVWSLVKLRKNQTPRLIPGLKDQNGIIKHSPEDKANLLAETIHNYHTMTANFTDTNTRQQVTDIISEFQEQSYSIPQEHQISIHEVRRIIAATKPYKAPGLDKIQNILLKKLPRKGLVQIYYICKACLTLNYFPPAWKEANIIPIKKPGKNSQDPTSYRPISLISNLGKVLERLILNRLKKFDNQIPDAQFGFRNHRTTELQLATLIDEAKTNIIKGKTTALATLDIEKAYDTIWHEGLIYKLINMAIPGYLIKIIWEFLKERTFQVIVSGVPSQKHNIPAGVPQGSTLSPFLFLFYLADIPERGNTKLRLFADDTAVSAVSMNRDQACTQIQEHLDYLADYFKKWCLKINADKSNIITFDHKINLPKTTVFYEDKEIPYNKSTKYLGVTLDKRLNFQPHIQEILKKARKATHFIWPFIQPNALIDSELKLRLITTYIRPILLYAAPVWSSTSINNFLRLETVENYCLRKIAGYRQSEITNKKLWKKTKWTRLSKIIFRRTKNFFDYKVKNLPCTSHIGNTIIPDPVKKIKSTLINQLILDYDNTA